MLRDAEGLWWISSSLIVSWEVNWADIDDANVDDVDDDEGEEEEEEEEEDMLRDKSATPTWRMGK